MTDTSGLARAQEQEIRVATALEMMQRLCRVRCVELDSHERVKELSRELLHHSIQYYFQEKVLEMMRVNIKEDLIYHICDAFQIHTILFTVGGKHYFFGPYVELLMTAREAGDLRSSLGLRDLDISEFLVYRGTFPTLTEHQVRVAVSAFLHIIEPESRGKMLRDLYYASGEQSVAETSASGNHHQLLVDLRYKTEREFIEAVSQGNAAAALRAQQKIAQDVTGLNQHGATMENRRIGAAIVRTLTRGAAVQAGIPPIIIDHISNASAREVIAARTPEQIFSSQDRMIRAFCKTIRDARSSQYSALVQVVLYALEHDYAKDVSLPLLAQEMNVSESHLIAAFKKEVGVTPNRDLNTVRMKQAALLLIHGSMTVSGVSEAVGIMDSNYFVKLFRKEFGETPSAYRKRYTV